jgi:hypothetical protein
VSQYVYAPGYAFAPALGAVSARGVTIDYYADPSSLTWSNKGMKDFHDALVKADLSFHKTMKDIVKVLRPLLGLLKTAGLNLAESDLDKVVQLPLPTCGMAMLLEVAFGGRKADDFFVGMMKEISQALIGSSGLFGIVAAACWAATTMTAFLAPPVIFALGTVAGWLTGAAVVCFLIGNILGSIAKGKMPSRDDFGEMMKSSAQLAGEPAPTEREIDLAYEATGAALAPIGVTAHRSPTFEAAVAAKRAAEERKQKQAIDEAKIKAKAQALQKALAARAKGSEDAKANTYSPPPPLPPDSGPDYNLRLYQAGWLSMRPLPSGVDPSTDLATLKDASTGPSTSTDSKQNDEQGGFPVVPVAVAAGLALLFLVRR